MSGGDPIVGVRAGLSAADRLLAWVRRRRLTPRERRDLCLWKAGRKRVIAARIEERKPERARGLRRQADELDREAAEVWAPLITD